MSQYLADDSGGMNVESSRLKGFRKRWDSSEFRSPGHLSVGSSSAHDIPDFNSEQFLQRLDERLDDEGSWSCAGQSVEYAPSTADEPTFESEGKVTVSGGVEHEYAWKLEALQSATKRARLYNEKFPWESSNLNGVFGYTDPFTNTIASGYRHMFAPAHEGIYDVLQSEMSSGTRATSSAEAASPPVRRIVLLGARRYTSGCFGKTSRLDYG